MTASEASAETIGGALSKAYLNNPDINQQRAAVRAADEGLPAAKAGYLPQINATANGGFDNLNTSVPLQGNSTTRLLPYSYGATITENIWNGNQTENSVSQAESKVLAARESLRYTEEQVLLQALTAYMDVLRDTAILDLNKNNVQVLQEQLRQTKDRFNVGEVTRTDVAQAEASLAGANAQELTSQSTLQASMARYRQAIGDDPKSLSPVSPISKPLPKTILDAVSISQVENPQVTASLHGVDVAALNIKINEGKLLPTINLQGSLVNSYNQPGFTGIRTVEASVMGQITIPIFQGGAEYAGIRAAKEQLSQQELSTDLARDQVRAAVVAAWGTNQNSTGIVRAAKAQVDAAEVALAGVREEAKVGQRTTLDVLNAQLTLLNARVQLVTAQHDAVVASYNLLSTVGRLSIQSLGLAVAEYDPKVHFNQVKSKFIGLHTPDGK